MAWNWRSLLLNRTVEMEPKAIESLRGWAMALPEVEEGNSCNKLAYKARKKAFLYVGSKDDSWNLMLKLTDSIDLVDRVAAEAEELGVSEHGWVSATFARTSNAPKELKDWVEESYRALAPKTLVKQLDVEN